MTTFGTRRATSLQPSSSFDSHNTPSFPSSSLAPVQSQNEVPQRPTFARTASASSFAATSGRRRDTSRLPIPEVVIEVDASSHELRRPRPFGRTQSLNTAGGAMTQRSDSFNIREWMNTSSPLTSLPSTSSGRASSSQVKRAPTKSPSPPKKKRESATPPAKATSSRLKRAISEDVFDSSEEDDKALLASFSDSDDSLADLTLKYPSSRKAGKARASTSPAPRKPQLNARPSTSRKTLESDASEVEPSEEEEEEVNTDTSPSKSTRGYGVKHKPYVFKPSLHQPNRPAPPTATFAQKAGIVPPSGKTGKFSIDSLLKEKKRQGKRGTDAKGLGLLDAATAKWDEQPVQPSGVDREAMKKLNDAYVARATEGLGEDGDEAASEDEEDEREELSEDSGDDYNALHFFEDNPDDVGTTGEGADNIALSARSEHLMLSLAAEEGDEDQQKALVKILARDRAATRKRGGKGRADGQKKDELAFWRRGRVNKPPEVLPLQAPQGVIEKSFNEALFLSASHLSAFLRSRVLSHSQPGSVDMVTSLLYLSILHGNLDVAGAALSSAEDLLRKWPAKSAPELGAAIRSLLMRALWLMGAEVGVNEPNGSEAKSSLAESTVLTAQHRGKLVYRYLRTIEAVFSAQSHDREFFGASELASILGYVHAMACDPASYGPATLSQFQQVMEAGIEKLQWASFKSWAHLLDASSKNGVKALSYAALLRTLQAFPNSSSKSRVLRRSRALSALFGKDEPPTPIFRGLKTLASTLSSDDPARNPFYIYPPSSAIQTNYAELNAKVELLAIAFSDLALQLCEPGSVASAASIETSASAPGEAEADVSMEEAKSRPHVMIKQDSEQSVNDLLASKSADYGTASAITATAPPTATPATSKLSSSSGPTLKPNRAFRLALQPYKSDQNLLRLFSLTPSSFSSNGATQEDLLSAPSFSRLREFHKILAALRGIYSRIHEGRGRLEGASATGGTSTGGPSAAADGAKSEAGAEEGGSTPSTTLDKTRCKDAIQRLILSVHYQCEVFTGFRMGGDAILEDEDDEEEEKEERERKRTREDEAGAALLEGEGQSGQTSMAKKQRLGPRASDQRSLGEFFTPPGKAKVMKRQQTVRFGRDEQEGEEGETNVEEAKVEVEGNGKSAVDEQAI
ncbi:hypothetical protein BCV69DRAFT_282646 [Microstroma glucosiphilum]|uniref:Uncharacterized protein n=1 Tax=Pseudomicrostroma glucosiphilum TaxID=1684307 RepID=A0A316U8H3_9BASI|nr:hypothetical protein BCV69DRAFT_282646 [Pseudomicrostroma glucosiphilum]PWN21148.1 hypothetical protein BCV69DRAFT_282646 [Pseudomicrostroma glucosiphilum]